MATADAEVRVAKLLAGALGARPSWPTPFDRSGGPLDREVHATLAISLYEETGPFFDARLDDDPRTPLTNALTALVELADRHALSTYDGQLDPAYAVAFPPQHEIEAALLRAGVPEWAATQGVNLTLAQAPNGARAADANPRGVDARQLDANECAAALASQFSLMHKLYGDASTALAASPDQKGLESETMRHVSCELILGAKSTALRAAATVGPRSWQSAAALFHMSHGLFAMAWGRRLEFPTSEYLLGARDSPDTQQWADAFGLSLT